LISLSVFYIIGSCAYALTTLPIPEDDLIPVFGARGSKATCTGKLPELTCDQLCIFVHSPYAFPSHIAQGFFIQMGTISCFTNVSLSVYYLLAIKYGQRERQLKQKRPWLILCPLIVGLAFAFAGELLLFSRPGLYDAKTHLCMLTRLAFDHLRIRYSILRQHDSVVQ